jgi:hypothetical protein
MKPEAPPRTDETTTVRLRPVTALEPSLRASQTRRPASVDALHDAGEIAVASEVERDGR